MMRFGGDQPVPEVPGVPAELAAMVDAEVDHLGGGSVMQVLARVLQRHRQMVLDDAGAALGLAATRELLVEIEARAAIGYLDEQLLRHQVGLREMGYQAHRLREILPPAVLDYRPGDE
jgi:hypothetical protein